MPELEIDMDKLRSDLSKSVTERFLREIPANAYKAPDPVTMESCSGQRWNRRWRR